MRRLGNPPPGIQASGSRCAVRRQPLDSRTVLGGKGSLRRCTHRRSLAACVPFCSRIIRDGRMDMGWAKLVGQIAQAYGK